MMRRRLASCHSEMLRALDNEQLIFLQWTTHPFVTPKSVCYQLRYCYQTSSICFDGQDDGGPLLAL